MSIPGQRGGSLLNLRGTLEERFWRYVARGEPDACWLWTGAKNSAGYGTIGLGGCTERGTAKMGTAHRLSYELHHGPIPPGNMVCHRCDVRDCVNPAHLFAGTARDNVQDAISMDERESERYLSSP